MNRQRHKLCRDKGSASLNLHAPVTRAYMQEVDFWGRCIQEDKADRADREKANAIRRRLEDEGFLPSSDPGMP